MEIEQVQPEQSAVTSAIRVIFEQLYTDKVFDYGNSMPVDELLSAFGVVRLQEKDAEGMSYKALKARFKKDDLAKLGVFGFVNKALLNYGKHFHEKNDHYHISLPSENQTIADNLLKSSQRKIAKARKLLKYTPKEYQSGSNELATKLLLAEKNNIH